MSLKPNGAVKKYLEKWAGVLKPKSDTNLPELSDTHSFSPKLVTNISSIKKLRDHKYQIRKSCMLSPSVSSKRRWFSPESLCKRLSLEQTNLNNRRDYVNNRIKKSVDNHNQMTTKAKRIVDDAKASRFKGFFSPRLLRNKIKDFKELLN